MDVVHWLCWATNEFCMEGVEIDKFNMTGREMCAMGKDNFLARTPQWMGDILWEHLENLQRGEYLIESVTPVDMKYVFGVQNWLLR